MALGTDPVAQYETREMLGYMRQTPRPTTFLADMLVKRRQNHRTKYLEIDQIFGNREIATYTNRNGGPHVVGKNGYNTLIHVAPYIYEQFEYKPSDVDLRAPGGTVYDMTDPVAALVGEWLDELDRRIVGREEQQLAEALQTGKVTVSGDDCAWEVDLKQAAGNLITLTGTSRWTEASTRDIDQNLIDWCQLPVVVGAPRPNVAIMDVKAMQLLKSDSAILASLDNRRRENGALNPKVLDEQNATYEGYLTGTGYNLDLYTYQGSFAIDGSADNYLDDYRVLLLNSNMDTRFHYGKIENFNAPNFMGSRFPNRWETPDGKQRFLTMESSPLAGLHQPNAVVSAVVTAAS